MVQDHRMVLDLGSGLGSRTRTEAVCADRVQIFQKRVQTLRGWCTKGVQNFSKKTLQESRPKLGHGLAMAWPWHGLAIALPWPGLDQAMTRPWRGHGLDMARPWPGHGQAVGKLLPISFTK